MNNVSALVYCNGDMIPTIEGIVFECPIDPKFITITEDMALAALRKTIFYAYGGCKILINVFLQSITIHRWWLCCIQLYGAQTLRWCRKKVFHLFKILQQRFDWVECNFWAFFRGNPCPIAQTQNKSWDNCSDAWWNGVFITQSTCCHFFRINLQFINGILLFFFKKKSLSTLLVLVHEDYYAYLGFIIGILLLQFIICLLQTRYILFHLRMIS